MFSNLQNICPSGGGRTGAGITPVLQNHIQDAANAKRRFDHVRSEGQGTISRQWIQHRRYFKADGATNSFDQNGFQCLPDFLGCLFVTDHAFDKLDWAIRSLERRFAIFVQSFTECKRSRRICFAQLWLVSQRIHSAAGETHAKKLARSMQHCVQTTSKRVQPRPARS